MPGAGKKCPGQFLHKDQKNNLKKRERIQYLILIERIFLDIFQNHFLLPSIGNDNGNDYNILERTKSSEILLK